MATETRLKALEQLLERTLSGLGYGLADFNLSNHSRMLRVFIDKLHDDPLQTSGNVTLADCEAATRQLQRVLAVEGIDAEVIDLRSLRPLDTPTLLASVARTHRALIVDEGWRMCSFAAEVSAQLMEGGFYDLDGPVARVCSAEVPMPYAKHMEDAALPQPASIVATVHEMLRRHG